VTLVAPSARIDLHLHTTASDGLLPPEQLVQAAHQVGLSAIAVTDHDTLAGVEAAQAAADAAKEGGFMGFGAEQVSSREKDMIGRVRTAVTRA